MQEWLKIALTSCGAFVFLFIISKLLGKKQVGQLDFIDYVVGISIGSIAAQMAFDTEVPFWYFLIAMSVFFLLDLGISLIGRKSKFLKNFLKGKPLVLISDGKIDYEQLKRSKLDINDLTGLARVAGVFDINDAAFAVLEKTGGLSVLPKAAQKPVVAEDLGLKPEEPELTTYVVMDGKINTEDLAKLGRDKEWLFEMLGVENERGLSEILIATYDEKNKRFVKQYK